jgi:hypothetical protein
MSLIKNATKTRGMTAMISGGKMVGAGLKPAPTGARAWKRPETSSGEDLGNTV